jgi:alkane 1-monooxygenase
MKFQDLKYLLAFTIPASCYFAIAHDGIWSWLTLIYAFVFIPISEQILELNVENKHIQENSEARAASIFFDLLLFANLPIIGMLLYFGFSRITFDHLATSDVIGKIISMGILLGACGINVAHELGHKNNFISEFTAKLLLTPCMYNHFTLQHNRGHHLNVGTPLDPATARQNEIVYSFWLRSSFETYIQAWELEITRLKRLNSSIFSFKNEMIWNTILTLIYLSIIAIFFSIKIMIFAIIVGIISFLLLETINYIEHYGLTRKLLDNGKYEKVELIHSWNSDHQLGRIVLYELTRHADHHFKANKKYQTLLHYDESPQLPYGYPASLLITLVPPLWFRLMNPVLDKIKKV